MHARLLLLCVHHGTWLHLDLRFDYLLMEVSVRHCSHSFPCPLHSSLQLCSSHTAWIHRRQSHPSLQLCPSHTAWTHQRQSPSLYPSQTA